MNGLIGQTDQNLEPNQYMVNDNKIQLTCVDRTVLVGSHESHL